MLFPWVEDEGKVIARFLYYSLYADCAFEVLM